MDVKNFHNVLLSAPIHVMYNYRPLINSWPTKGESQCSIGNDRLQYFNKFGFGSVTVFRILRKSVTVRLRFTSCKKPRFRFRFRLVKNPGF